MGETSAADLAWNAFASPTELASALAGRVAATLRDAVARRGTGFVAVSGGTTPALFFRTLSNEELDWSKVTVVLVDERFVDRSSPRANAGLVKANLLQNKAAAARFEDLYRAAADLDAAAAVADNDLHSMPWPLDVTVLGMGGDGHTASFFPGAANLAALLDPASTRVVLPTYSSDGEPRLTLPLARLVEAPLVALHIEGAAKRKVLESALADGSRLPIRIAIDHAATPVQLFWAP